MNSLLAELTAAGRRPKETALRSLRETGKKGVGCFPIYVPEEIIHAAGLLPIGLWGGQTEFKQADKYLQSFCCSIMRANVELGIKGVYKDLAAVIITAYCDTLRAVLNNWPAAVPGLKAIPMVYPQNRLEPAALEYMLEKFRTLQKELESISGIEATPDRLADSLALYEKYRAGMREFTQLARSHPLTVDVRLRHNVVKAAYYMDKAVYTEKLLALNQWLASLPEEKGGIPVIVTGLLAEPESFLALFAENGLFFAGDDLAQESRQFRVAARPDGSPLERIARRFLDLRGCTFFCDPLKTRGELLIQMARDTGAQGIVVCMYKFCDPEEFDYPVYKEEIEAAGLPLLYLEIEQRMDGVEQLRTRIQSFAETLRS
ncbi:MAG: 2-hydroxyacyl-CoA dehydratase family protein [Peptococcaceae bacterium]|jgi:benzoyl-CoA reductase/2-hydroxyglutaryl-CoA dehydratase subunit BcrC/BadD/HgdB|nr:2-hydroxyacyl-CoA dehydratase family protein [Peptococcaceae bacterium]